MRGRLEKEIASLEGQRATYAAQLEQARCNLDRTDGALMLARHLLARLDEPEEGGTEADAVE